MRTLTFALTAACALAFALPAMAQQAPGGQQGGGGKQGPTPEQFQHIKSRMLENHQKRAAIIQQAQSCIQGATAPEQLRTCIQQERQAAEQLRDAIRKERGNRPHGGLGGGRQEEEED